MVWYTCASALLLLIWLLATERIFLRLKTPEEAARATPGLLFWASGLVLLAGGVLAGAGERAVRYQALGMSNHLSEAFVIIAPASSVVGLFNLVLVN